MGQSSVGSTTLRVMVVEDNLPNRELLVRVLAHWGFEDVVSTGDPREFLELYRSRMPDLVFMDFRMPYLNGQDLLELLGQEEGALDRTRVVVLTGDSEAALAEEAMGQGASAVVTKPYILNDLKVLVERLVGELPRGEEAG